MLHMSCVIMFLCYFLDSLIKSLFMYAQKHHNFIYVQVHTQILVDNVKIGVEKSDHFYRVGNNLPN